LGAVVTVDETNVEVAFVTVLEGEEKEVLLEVAVEAELEAVDTATLPVPVATIASAATEAALPPRIADIGARPGKKLAGMVGMAIDVLSPRPELSSPAMVVIEYPVAVVMVWVVV
jgi:hypothetical protein